MDTVPRNAALRGSKPVKVFSTRPATAAPWSQRCHQVPYLRATAPASLRGSKGVRGVSPRPLPPCTANPAPRPCSPYVPRSARNPPAPSPPPAASELPVPQSPSTPPATESGYPRPPPTTTIPGGLTTIFFRHTRPAHQQRQNQHQPAQQRRPWIVSYLHSLCSLARQACWPWGWRSPPNAETAREKPQVAHGSMGRSLPCQRIERLARMCSSKS